MGLINKPIIKNRLVNKTMNILSLSAYHYPESVAGSHLRENLNQAFADNNFKITTIVPTPTRGVSAQTRRIYKKKLRQESKNGMEVVRRFKMFPEGTHPAQRALRYILSNINQLLIGSFTKNVDLIFVSSTPPIQGATAALLKKIKRKPFVYNLQDIFPDSMVGTQLTHKGSLLWKIGRAIENFTYRNADKIIVISEGFKQNIIAKGVPESKIEVVYNWVDENEVVSVERDKNILFDRYNLDRDKFYVTYNGNIGLTQNMEMLLDVANMLKEESNIHFVIMGEGAYKKEVLKRIELENIENVTVLPFQPYEEISHVFSMGNVGLVISKENVGENSVPSKTWSIMSAERPVLASFDEGSEIQNIIEENKAGLFTKAGDKDELYDAILKLYNNPKLCNEMGQNGRAFILKNLTREIGTSKYVEVIKSVIK